MIISLRLFKMLVLTFNFNFNLDSSNKVLRTLDQIISEILKMVQPIFTRTQLISMGQGIMELTMKDPNMRNTSARLAQLTRKMLNSMKNKGAIDSSTAIMKMNGTKK